MTAAEAFFSREFPVPGGTEIVCVGVRLAGESEDWRAAAGPFVTEQERQRARRFVQPLDGVRHLVGRALARRVLGAAARTPLGDFPCTPQGKPVCPQAPVDFSISHSGLLVWVAFAANGKVGIDVEQTRETRDLLSLAALLHPEEYAELLRRPPPELPSAFYRSWVRKEAVLKASGAGLSRQLDSFRVRTDERESGWLDLIDGRAPETWFTQDIPVPEDYHCSVASSSPASGATIVYV